MECQAEDEWERNIENLFLVASNLSKQFWFLAHDALLSIVPKANT